MKKLLILILFVPTFAMAQTNIATLPIFIGNLDSAKVLGSINGLTKNFWGVDLVKARVKYTDTVAMFAGYTRVNRFTDSIALLRALANSRITLAEANALYTPLTRTLTINGTSFDLSANRSWTIASSGVSRNADSLGGQPAAFYPNRVNHTGSQAISTVTGLQVALDGKQVSGSYATTTQNALKLNITDTANKIPRIIPGANTFVTGDYPNVIISTSGGGGGGEGLDATLAISNTTNKQVILRSNRAAADLLFYDSSGNKEFISIQPIVTSNPLASNFSFVGANNAGASVPYSSRDNYVFKMGYNINSNGTRKILTEPTLNFSFETSYTPNNFTKPSTEFHLVSTDTLGNAYRPITGMFARDGSSGNMTISGDVIQFNRWAGSAGIRYNLNNGDIDYTRGTTHTYDSSLGFSTLVRNAAGSGFINVLSTLTGDEIGIGISNASSIKMGANVKISAGASIQSYNANEGVSVGSVASKQELIVNAPSGQGISLILGSDKFSWINDSRFILQYNNGAKSPIAVYSDAPDWSLFLTGSGVGIRNSNPLDALDVTGNIRASGSIRSGIPTGGTSALWKLGSAAIVSPTAANRTIQVEIGGVVYFIAAKTTND